MSLADMLSAAGRPIGACAWCARVFPTDRDHAGRPHAPGRRYCAITCRRFARNARRRPVRAHLARWAHLIALHEAEDAGQLSVVDAPLPSVPPIPTLEYAP